MVWRVLLFGILAIRAEAFSPYGILRWAGEIRSGRHVVKPKPKPKPKPMRGARNIPSSLMKAAPDRRQQWSICDRRDSVSADAVQCLTPNPDKTISWGSSGLCIEASGYRRGDAIGVDRCTGSPAQMWELVPKDDGDKSQFMNLRLTGTNNCITVDSDRGELKGAPVQLQECDYSMMKSLTLEDLLPSPSQGEGPASSLRHVIASAVSMAALGALALGASMWRRQKRPRAAFAGQGCCFMGLDAGGVSVALQTLDTAPRKPVMTGQDPGSGSGDQPLASSSRVGPYPPAPDVEEEKKGPAVVAEPEPDDDYNYSLSTSENHRSDRSQELIGEYAEIRATLDIDYHGTYTAERQEIQDVIIRNTVGHATAHDDPWVVFTAGAMGAGKGYTVKWMSREGYFPLEDIVHVDPDRLRTELPEWEGYLKYNSQTAGTMTHREAGYCVEIAQEAAMQQNKHVWIDGSLRDAHWYTQVFQDIRKRYSHYRIAIFHIFCNWRNVCLRTKARAEVTGREVPQLEIRSSYNDVPDSVEKLRPLADFSAHIQNDDVPTLASVCKGPNCVDNAVGDWEEICARFASSPCPK